MRRAFLMSVIIHMLAISMLFDFPGFESTTRPEARGRVLATLDRADGGSMGNGARIPEQVVTRRGRSVQGGNAVSMARAGKVSAAEPGGHGQAPKVALDELPSDSLNDHGLPEDLQRDYRIKLARELRQSKRYPQPIKDRGMQGVVWISILQTVGSNRPTISLVKSSGYQELDNLAMDSLDTAIGRVSSPAEGRGFGFRMSFAVEYRLAD